MRGFITSIFIFLLFSCKSQILDTSIQFINYHLHFSIIKGSGIPILFESGAGNDGSVWQNILIPIYTLTGATLITYDRSGFGKSTLDTSDEALDHHGLKKGVEDLYFSLGRLGYSGGVMIVAHSYGAFYATFTSSAYPDFVKSLIFIDGNLPCFFTNEYVEKMTNTYAREIEMAKHQHPGDYYLYKTFSNAVELSSRIQISDSIPILDIISEKTPFTDSTNMNRWRMCHQMQYLSRKNYEGFTAHGTGHYIFKDNPELIINSISSQYIKIFRPN